MDNLSGTVVQINEKGVLTVKLSAKEAIFTSHMPFIKSGGLFIATKKLYQLGYKVEILLQLMEEPEQFPVVTKVVWITPTGAQGGLTAGIGVQFQGDDNNELRRKIATYTAGTLKSERPTDTM